MISHNFHHTILRSYDIRGVVGITLFNADAFSIGLTFGTITKNNGKGKVVVCRDGRISSEELSKHLIDGLISSGCDVIDIGQGPTPMLYFADLFFDANSSIQITGSHNPSNYNGFKFVLNHNSFFAKDIQNLGALSSKGVNIAKKGSLQEIQIFKEYTNRLKLEISFNDFGVAWDAGNGVTGPIIEEITSDRKKHIKLFCDVDGNFPNHHPNPVEPKNLIDLKKVVNEKKLVCGLGFDGDGDRVGLIDGKGRLVPGDILTAYLSSEIVEKQNNSIILFDVKSSNTALNFVKKIGGKPMICKTGHSFMKSKLKETNAPLAGEMSGHIFISDNYYGYDDAVYVAIRLLNLINYNIEKNGISITEFVDNLPKSYSTPECKIECPDEKKFKIIEDIKVNVISKIPLKQINTLDGIRVNKDNGWWLIRASNTESTIIVRIEGNNQNELENLILEVKSFLNVAKINWKGP